MAATGGAAAPALVRADENGDYLLHEADAALRGDRVGVARELYTKALAAALTQRARAEALEGLGHVAFRSGRPREAVGLFEEAVDLRDSAVWESTKLAEGLGRAYADLGELDAAKIVFEKCRQRFAFTGDRVNEVRFAILAGYALTDRGRFEEAEAVLASAIESGASIDDPMVRAQLCWAQARLRGEQGEAAVAAGHALEALEILEQTDQSYFIALTYQLLASLYNDLGRSEDALALLRKATPLLMAEATPLDVAQLRIEEARALAALGEREGAAALAMRVVAQLDGKRPGDAGRAYVLLGEIFDQLGEVARARELYEVGITLLEAQGPSRYLAAAYRRLGELFESEYRTRDALSVLKRALAVQDRVQRTPPADATNESA